MCEDRGSLSKDILSPLLYIIVACEHGWYGYNCTQRCECGEFGYCDKKTGECTCHSGYTGARCNISKYNCMQIDQYCKTANCRDQLIFIQICSQYGDIKKAITSLIMVQFSNLKKLDTREQILYMAIQGLII